MKFELQTQKVKKAVGSVERTAGKHLSLPVLSSILIEAGKRAAVFKATNLDIGIEAAVPIKADKEGSVAVPAHTLSAFISGLPAQDSIIKFEEVNGNLLISTPHSKGNIKTVPKDDFPAIPRVSGGEEFLIQADLLAKGLRAVWYSASVSAVKPELSSVYLYRDGDYLTFVATDSFRLAEKRIKAPVSAKPGDLLIPSKNIGELIRVLESVAGEVKVRANKNLISFEQEGLYAVSRVIDGVFPDYRQIVPKAFATEIIALKEDIMNGLKISNVFSDKFNQVRIFADPKKKLFEVQTKNSDIGENKTSIDAAVTGEQMEVNFNQRYIADCFQSIEADSVSMQLAGLNRPMVVRPVSGDQTFMYVVMPMNR